MKVIITGASRGIGRGIAQALSRQGHTLGLLSRSRESLAAVQQETGAEAIAPCDLRDPEAVASAIDALANKLGGLDALVNNAGQVVRKNIFDLTIEEWQEMVETNLSGMFYATRAALPYLKEHGGHIINLSSISGYMPLPGGSGYAATKYGVTGFSESLFGELREYGIKVGVIFPGSVDSQSHRHEDSDASWKVDPEEVGEAVQTMLSTSGKTCIRALEIRPISRSA